MFAVGHIALSYLLGRSSAKLLKVKAIVPFFIALSILPDIDIFSGSEHLHRGPTHSILFAVLVFVPFLIAYRRVAIPYLVALLSHLLGDFFIGSQMQLFWPFSSQPTSPAFGLNIRSPLEVAVEASLFLVAVAVMFLSRDLWAFFKPRLANFALVVPIASTVLPVVAPGLLAFEVDEPLLLLPEELFFLVLFSVSVLISALWVLKRLPVRWFPTKLLGSFSFYLWRFSVLRFGKGLGFDSYVGLRFAITLDWLCKRLERS